MHLELDGWLAKESQRITSRTKKSVKIKCQGVSEMVLEELQSLVIYSYFLQHIFLVGELPLSPSLPRRNVVLVFSAL